MSSKFDKSRYPVNSRGFAVVPCIRLTPENMTEELIGLKVTIGLEEAGGSTHQGEIHSFTDKKLVILVSGKKKDFDYNPNDIQLQCYQFGDKILFSNENVVEKEQTPVFDVPSTPEPKVSHDPSPSTVVTPKKSPAKKRTRKKLTIKAAPVESNSPSASAKATQSMPLYGISWE
ncbi:MAG: hypothetical protein CMF22_11995 [Idiomarinaceae bacterium]|nr:hypothetical protein [Idiomarinaceae bacterium]